jgi:3-methyladenine DNA glycosylase/8-oxoguanine DNA glycosylase
MEWTLSAVQPFILSAVIGSHGWAQLPPFSQDEATTGLRRVERLRSAQVVDLLVTAAPGGVRVQVGAPLTDPRPPHLDREERQEVSAKVRWMLGLDQDLTAFYELARHEPKLAAVEEKAQGRVLRSPALFEDVIKTILTTNTAWGGTKRMAANLVGRLGSPLPQDPSLRAFPTAEQVAAVDEDLLRNEVRLGYRAPYVLELAQAVASGDVDLEGLKGTDLPTAELRQRLLAIKGVGAYAAANLLMILGRYDDLPIDSWAYKMVSHEWHDGEPVGAGEVKAAFERWGEWQGLAYWFWDWSYKG